ncbi:hypothetical protein [Microcoleus sp. B4-C1]|uniref:hypothetical protein n=1 Tax=Microcoleus sp. B4-C1 TaxID=2818660 RepID=UPI002FD02BA6
MYTYTATQLEHKTFGELKAIARELNVVPTGDRRCRQAWIDAIVGVELPLLALITFPAVETDSVQEPMAPAAKTSPGVEIDATQLEHKTFGELKAIARQLNVVLSGDSRKKRTWELAIAAQAQIMDISIDAACNPILRTYCLGGRNRFTSEAIEQALDLVERHCYPSVFRLKTTPTEPIENSPGAQLAAKVLPGIAHFQNLIELALTETSPGAQIDPVQEPIDLNTGKIFPLHELIDLNTGKIFPLHEAIETSPGVNFDPAEFQQTHVAEIENYFASFNDEQPPNRGDGKGRIEPELSQSAIGFYGPPVTFSPRFLATYPPYFGEVRYKAEATTGQLNLFEPETEDEPPDPDDFESLDAFREAIALWDAQHPEPLEISLDSMCEWAPCPDAWYEPEPSEVLEHSPTPESSSTCNFSIPTFDAWCDCAARQTDSDEPPDTGIFAKLLGPKPPKFPPRAIGQFDDMASASSGHSGRSPPGGDAVF